MIKRIHVNRHHIAANKKGANKPPFTVKTSKANHKGFKVRIEGPSTLIYRPERPLSCGAVAWVETRSSVFIDDQPVE